jgi:hypothetical protein
MSRRAWRRASSCTTFAGRTGTWRAGRRTTYRCRCISSPLSVCEAPRGALLRRRPPQRAPRSCAARRAGRSGAHVQHGSALHRRAVHRPLSYVPVEVRTGGVDHHSAWLRRYKPRNSPVLSVRGKGDRPDSNRYREDHNLECCRYTTVTRKKAGTTGFEPATTRSTTERSGRAELRPLVRACFTMKQALKVRGWDSNPRSRAHEAREDSLSSTAHLPGWSRTSGLRFPKPAGWPSPLRAVGVLTRPPSPRRAAPRHSRTSPPDAGRRSRSPGPRSRTR